MSEDIIKQAREIRRSINDLDVLLTYVSAIDFATKKFNIVHAINSFTVAETNNSPDLGKLASSVIQNYTILASEGAISENSGSLLSKWNKLVPDYNALSKNYDEMLEKKNKQIEELKKSHSEQLKEMQSTIDGLYEQVGIAKGMYQECSKRIEQMIERAGMKV